MEPPYAPRFLKGIQEFNERRFFECHETLEDLWWEEHGEDRLFYQGIIQISVGYLKWEEGVPAGSIKLWRAGLEKLAAYPPTYMGLRLDLFIREVQVNLIEVELAYARRAGSPDIRVPTLSLVA